MKDNTKNPDTTFAKLKAVTVVLDGNDNAEITLFTTPNGAVVDLNEAAVKRLQAEAKRRKIAPAKVIASLLNKTGFFSATHSPSK